jgi:hypothetical protein
MVVGNGKDRGFLLDMGPFFVDADHRHVYAHRFSYDACNFSPLGSHQAHHTCENKSCVNPYHIQKLTPVNICV